MKKLFGGINLTWPKVIIMAIIAAAYTATMAMIPGLLRTSFHDIVVSFEVWIFFGIFIIMNSKSAKDSALKCLVFFVISQPLIYLIQDVINHSRLFITYYRFWVGWTVACVPMGFFGYYMKKDKWWGLLILTPIMLFLGVHLSQYLGELVFEFPQHLLTVIFIILSLIIYPLAVFNNKKIKITGLIIDILIIIAAIVLWYLKPFVYNTELLHSSENNQFDDSYKVYFVDKKYGNLDIKYEQAIECWAVHAEIKHGGKTEFVLESPEGDKKTYTITIKSNTYDIEEEK